MCVICVKNKGVKMPTRANIYKMWKHNPDGAGFMFARDGKVYIRKGFMNVVEFLDALESAKIKDEEACVLHFRISTQAGVNKEMTHPFALVRDIEKTKVLNAKTDIGIAHNGIIRMTSNGDKEYSDTAIFIAYYMSKLIRRKEDFYDDEVLEMIERLGASKFALMNGAGDIQLLGAFNKVNNGLYYSNLLHELDDRIWNAEPVNNGYTGYWNNLFGTKNDVRNYKR